MVVVRHMIGFRWKNSEEKRVEDRLRGSISGRGVMTVKDR